MTILCLVSTELSLLPYTPWPLLLNTQPWLPSSLILIQQFCGVPICSVSLAWSQFLLFSHSQNILLGQNINLLHHTSLLLFWVDENVLDGVPPHLLLPALIKTGRQTRWILNYFLYPFYSHSSPETTSSVPCHEWNTSGLFSTILRMICMLVFEVKRQCSII